MSIRNTVEKYHFSDEASTKMRDSGQVGHPISPPMDCYVCYTTNLHLKQLTSDMLGLRSAFVS